MYRRVTPYVGPSGQAVTISAIPPKSADINKYSRTRSKPRTPPTRGPASCCSIVSPIIVGALGVPDVASAPSVAPAIVVCISTADVKLNDPRLLSGSAQLTVHSPEGGICVSAAETVLKSVPSCGTPRPTSVPLHANESPIAVTTSGLAKGF